MKKYEITANIEFQQIVGYIYADNEEEAIKKGEKLSYYKQLTNNVECNYDILAHWIQADEVVYTDWKEYNGIPDYFKEEILND